MKQTFSRFFGLNEKELGASNTTNEEVKKINIKNIVPNRFQPRTIFDEEKIAELAMTIHTHGMIQPIVVREVGEDAYEIIAGERRFRAAKSLGWTEVSVLIKDLSDTETASIALIENLQREELTPIEEAMAYGKLLELHNLTQEALAQRLGRAQSTVANKLRLLKLPEAVQEAILRRDITERHARALIVLKNEEKQLKLLQEIVEKQLNVKQTEERIEKMLATKETMEKPKSRRKVFGQGTRIAMNTIHRAITMIEETGMTIESVEEDLEEFYQFTIRVPKK